MRARGTAPRELVHDPARSFTSPVPESLVARLRDVPGAASVTGEVSTDGARPIGPDGKVIILQGPPRTGLARHGDTGMVMLKSVMESQSGARLPVGLIVPHLDASIGERVRVRIRARDVSLSIRKPTEISILNVLPAFVAAIDEETGPIVDLELAVGSATLVARITRRSFQQLGIRTGQELYALIKAVSFDQRSVGYA